MNGTKVELLERFLNMEKDHSLVKHYLYPLTGGNYGSFGRWGNIERAFVSKDGEQIFIKLKKRGASLSYSDLASYQYSAVINKETLLVFKTPIEFAEDMSLLLKGKYTEMGKQTKDKICKASALKFNRKEGNFYSSSSILQALYVDSPFREGLSEYFGLRVTELPREIISKIPENSSIYIENYIKEGK